MDITPDTLLEFWFPPLPYSADALNEAGKLWFFPSAEQNTEIHDRFHTAVGKARNGELDHWDAAEPSRLALVLLLDQLTRCVYRGTADAFVGDTKALALALASIDSVADSELSPVQQQFLFMPLQHSEDLAIQDQAVAVLCGLAERADGPEIQVLRGAAEHAHLHRDIIAQFGRFPHRNAVLGRPNTPAEDTYLASDAPTFGQ
jgi:uncharacterized protein (DUF924 family)